MASDACNKRNISQVASTSARNETGEEDLTDSTESAWTDATCGSLPLLILALRIWFLAEDRYLQKSRNSATHMRVWSSEHEPA